MAHILLVDDDHHFRRTLCIQLELEGYHITEVENGDVALSYLERQFKFYGNMPDLVITDVKMPGMSGIQLFRKIEEIYPFLPVIVISAFELNEELKSCPMIKKPFKIENMLSVVNQSLENHSTG